VYSAESHAVICLLGELSADMTNNKNTTKVEIKVETPATFEGIGGSGELTNAAFVFGNRPDLVPDNNIVVEQTTVGTPTVLSADLSITKDADLTGVVETGELVTYTLTVTNAGPAPAIAVGVQEFLDPRMSFHAVEPRLQCGYVEKTHAVACLFGELSKDASETVTITVRPELPGKLFTAGVVAARRPKDPDPQYNANVLSFDVTPTEADLEIKKSIDEPAVAGEKLTYTLTVTNNGSDNAAISDTAHHVIVTDILPQGATLELPLPKYCRTEDADRVVICNLGTLQGNVTTSVSITVTPAMPGPLLNAAVVASAAHDPNQSNNYAVLNTVVMPPTADLRISSRDNANPIVLGDNVTYTHNVKNKGPARAEDVNITHLLPPSATFIQDKSSVACSEFAGGVVVCNIGVLDSGQSVNIDVTVLPSRIGPLVSSALVTQSTPDSDFGNNSIRLKTSVVPENDDDGAGELGENRDGNNDGILDKYQASVATFANSADGRYLTLAAQAGRSLQGVRAIGNPSPGDVPPGAEFPVGFFEFRVDALPAQGAGGVGRATVRLHLPPGVAVDSYYAYGPTPDNSTNHWYPFLFDGETGAEIIPGTGQIVLHYVDGGRGDADLTVNGQIVDPAAPAVLPSVDLPAQGGSFEILLAGTDIVVREVLGGELYRAAAGAIPGLRIVGGNGNDSLTIDFAGGNPVPVGGLVFEGRGSGDNDTLIVGNVAATTVEHTLTSAESGVVAINDSLVTYTGLEPIVDNASAVNRVFTFPASSDDITLNGGDNPNDDVLRIDSNHSEVVNFLAPTGSLTVNLGDGDDRLTLDLEPIPILNGQGGGNALVLAGRGVNLNLTSIADTNFAQFTAIDISGSGANTLTLDAQEVLNISNASNTLIVRRDSNDTVNKGGGWTQRAGEMIGKDAFDVFTQGAATLKVQTTSLQVTSAVVTGSGVTVGFSSPIHGGTLNLYDVDPSVFGPADVTLVGNVVGPIGGSLIVDGNQIEFIATGGPLPADTYTLTLHSAEGGFKSLDTGELLDGEYGGSFPSGDNTPGGDFVYAFTIGEPGPVVVSLPNFARGPDQAVNVPAAAVGGAGIPVRLNNAAGVESVDMTFTYDPHLLTVTDVVLGPDAPADSHLVTNLTEPGRAILSYYSLDPMSTGPAVFAAVIAKVPETAPYRAAHVLDITEVNINEGRMGATGDDAVHVVAYLGDATGNRYYSGLDGQKVARVAAGRDTGFEAYPTIDALIVGNVNGDNTLDGLDRDCIMQEAVGRDCLHIPPLPRHQSLESRVAAAHGQISASGEVQEYTLDVTQGPANGIYSIQVWDHHEAGFDPDAVQILDANGAPVAVRQVVADAAADGPSRSAVVVQLAPGQYRVRVGSQNSAVGDYRIDVSMPGASNGDGVVHARDLQLAEAAMLQHHFGFNAITQELFGNKLGIDLSTSQFRPAFDANLDGQIDPMDMDAITTNFGSGSPIQARATLTPLPNGDTSAAVPESPPVIATPSGDGTLAPLQNPDRPTDVNADNLVTPLDVLLVINTINSPGSRPAGDTLSERGMADGEAEYAVSAPFYDVNGDYVISPLDVLMVINDLNANGARTAGSAGTGGEGESSGAEELVSESLPIVPVVASNLGSGIPGPAALRPVAPDDASVAEGGVDSESPTLVRSTRDKTSVVHTEVFGDELVLADALERDADVLTVLAADLVEIGKA